MSKEWIEKQRIESAISKDVFDLNYNYRDNYDGYTHWLSKIDKEDPNNHRYGHLYEGYLEVFSVDYPYITESVIQIKPVEPLYFLDKKLKGKETNKNLPSKGFLKISGTRFVSACKDANLTDKLPRKSNGKIYTESFSFMNEREKYAHAKEIGLLDTYKAKAIKYESIPGYGIPYIFPLIPDSAFRDICENQNIPIPQEIPYLQCKRWDFFKKHSKEIYITEGSKKACSLISHGKLAIASFSITTHSVPKTENPKAPLKDDIKAFLKGRDDLDIKIVFDCDEKPATKKAVNKQARILAKKLKKYGKVSTLSWEDKECKGVDDFLHKYGCLDACIESYPEFNLENTHLFGRKLTPHEKIHTRYLSEDLIRQARIDNKKAIFLKSAQNTGKTTMIKKELASYYEFLNKNFSLADDIMHIPTGLKIRGLSNQDGVPDHQARVFGTFLGDGKSATIVDKKDLMILSFKGRFPINLHTLVAIHRQTLSSNLALKLNLQHYIDEKLKGSGKVFCIDSLLQENNIEGYYTDLFIDECSQVALHILSSNTEIKNKRLPIVNRLVEIGKNIIKENGILKFADADLDDATVAFYCQLFDLREEDITIVENTYKPFSNRELYRYEDVASIRQQSYDCIEKNERIIIHTSGQKVESTHGSYNLDKDIKKRFPGKKIIRLDSQTLSDENNEAFEMLNHLEQLKNYDIIIASSSLNTGVDLTEDLIGPIDNVFGIFYGNYPLNDFEQSLERYRGDAPRHVFLPEVSNNKVDYGSTSAQKLYENIMGHSNLITEMYGIDEMILANNLLAHYCNYASVINNDYKHLSNNFYKRAEGKGYQLKRGFTLDEKSRKVLKKEFKEMKEDSKATYRKAVSEADVIDDLTAKKIEIKKQSTFKERTQLEKYKLGKKYLVTPEEVTPELLEINEHYQGIYNRYQDLLIREMPDVIEMRDKKNIQYMTKDNKQLYPLDLNNTMKKPMALAYKYLRMKELIGAINSMDEFSQSDLIPYIESLKNQQGDIPDKTREYIKKVLKIDLFSKLSPTRLAGQLLRKFGYKLEKVKSIRKEGKIVRLYKVVSVVSEQFLTDLFTRWTNRDLELLASYNESVAHESVI